MIYENQPRSVKEWDDPGGKKGTRLYKHPRRNLRLFDDYDDQPAAPVHVNFISRLKQPRVSEGAKQAPVHTKFKRQDEMLGGKESRDTRTSTTDNILDSDSFWEDSQYPVVRLDNAWELRISSSLNEKAKKSMQSRRL